MSGGTQALATLQAYVDADGALVVSVSGSSTGVVISIAGTANQVLVNGGTVAVGGAVTLSVPSDFRVAASGVFGSLTFAPMGEITAVSTTTSLPRGISNFQISTGTDSANFSAYKARGVIGAETIVVTGDILANFRGWGYDGAAYLNMASIRYVVTGTVALNRVPTQIEFYTATNAAPSVLTKVLTLGADGNATFTGSVTANLDLIGATFQFPTQGRITPNSNANWQFRSAAGTAGVALDFLSDGVLKVFQRDGTTNTATVQVYNVLVGHLVYGTGGPRLQFDAGDGVLGMFNNVESKGVQFSVAVTDGTLQILSKTGADTATAKVNKLQITGLGAFAAGDKYVIADATGNFHVSALGPAS